MGDYALIGGSRIRAEHGELLVGLDHVHWMVHHGFLFQAEHVASVADNGSLDIQLTTGSKETHARFAIPAGGACSVFLYEAVTSSGGTNVTVINNRRSSANVPEAKVVHSPVVTATGTTLIPGRYLPGGTSQQTRIGGEVREQAELVLKPGTKYLLRVTNVSGGAVKINPVISFYEHDEE